MSEGNRTRNSRRVWPASSAKAGKSISVPSRFQHGAGSFRNGPPVAWEMSNRTMKTQFVAGSRSLKKNCVSGAFGFQFYLNARFGNERR